MRIKVGGSILALVVGLGASAAWACPKAGEGAKAKGGCGKKAMTVADKSPCAPGCTKECCKKKGAAKTAGKDAALPCHGKNATTVADKGKGGCSKPCHGKDGATAGREGCPITKKVKAVLASMPAMKYRVNGKVDCCLKSAEAMAKKSGKPIEFLVRDEVLTDKGQAMAKLAALLEKEAESLQAIQFVAGGKVYGCPVTARSVAKKTHGAVTYRVGGVDFEKREHAEKALAAIRTALANVKLQYKVGDKTFGCSKMAGEKCKKAGKKMTYVIGDEETCCEKTAKLMLAETRVRTIVETAVSTSFSL